MTESSTETYFSIPDTHLQGNDKLTNVVDKFNYWQKYYKEQKVKFYKSKALEQVVLWDGLKDLKNDELRTFVDSLFEYDKEALNHWITDAEAGHNMGRLKADRLLVLAKKKFPEK